MKRLEQLTLIPERTLTQNLQFAQLNLSSTAPKTPSPPSNVSYSTLPTQGSEIPRFLPTLPILLKLRVMLDSSKPPRDLIPCPGPTFVGAFELAAQSLGDLVVGHTPISTHEDYEARLLVVERVVIYGCELSGARALSDGR